jgi:hypothetical protein
MASNTNEFLVWDNQVPLVNMGTDSEFDIWDNQVPNEDRDEGTTTSTAIRRRVFDF